MAVEDFHRRVQGMPLTGKDLDDIDAYRRRSQGMKEDGRQHIPPSADERAARGRMAQEREDAFSGYGECGVNGVGPRYRGMMTPEEERKDIDREIERLKDAYLESKRAKIAAWTAYDEACRRRDNRPA